MHMDSLICVWALSQIIRQRENHRIKTNNWYGSHVNFFASIPQGSIVDAVLFNICIFLAFLVYWQSQDDKYTGRHSKHLLPPKVKTQSFIEFQKLNLYECLFFRFVLSKALSTNICLFEKRFSLDIQQHTDSSKVTHTAFFKTCCCPKYPSLYPFWVFLEVI